jgi:hypothetical protein
MNDLAAIGRVAIWLAILGLATLVVGTVIQRIQAEVKL